MRSPLAATITSPGRSPASAPADPAWTRVTTAPRLPAGSPRLAARRSSRSWVSMPSEPRRTSPCSRSTNRRMTAPSSRETTVSGRACRMYSFPSTPSRAHSMSIARP